jgi:heme exporter protein C
MWTYGLFAWIIGVIWAVFFIVPPAEGLGYLVRIAFFHIPVAWVAVLAFLLAAWWAYRYLKTRDMIYDLRSAVSSRIGLGFCIAATVSGAFFSKLTWGAYWNWDPRQTTIFVLLLIYGAYLTLRSSIEDDEQRARVSSVYALLSFLTVPFLVFIIPRFYFSLHPEPLINSTGKLHMEAVMVYVLMASLAGCTGIYWWLLQQRVKRKEPVVNKLAAGSETP